MSAKGDGDRQWVGHYNTLFSANFLSNAFLSLCKRLFLQWMMVTEKVKVATTHTKNLPVVHLNSSFIMQTHFLAKGDGDREDEEY